MSCAEIEALLLAWWCGELPEREAGDVEEHLFACARCARDAEVIAALAAGTRALVRGGRIHAAVLPSLLRRLASEGMRIRTFRVGPNESVPCGPGTSDELLVARLDVPLAGLSRVDCDAAYEATGETARLEDVPFDARANAIFIAERVAHARQVGAGPLRVTLFGTGADGRRRLGTWTLVHDPAGPPPDRASA